MRKETILAGLVAFALIAGANIAQAQYTTTSSVSGSSAANVSISARPEFSFLAGTDLSIGSTGTDVANLQGLLVELGYLTMPAGATPGYFGTLTRDALSRYQQALGLSASGTLDTTTKMAITDRLVRLYPVALGGSLINTSGTTATGAPAGNPLAATGYWYNGNWYNTLPYVGTSTISGISGYWYNGTWYPASTGGSVASNGNSGTGFYYNGVWYSTNTPNIGGGENADSGIGYWYNGTWYPVQSTNGGGYYSSNPYGGNMTVNSSNNVNASGSVTSTNTSSSQPQTTNATGSAVNTSTNLTPTGYWQNGNWYATTPPSGWNTANSGIIGYWQNNAWYSADGTQTTSYGAPNPTNPTGTGYWQNGVWYSTNSSNSTSGSSM